MKYATFHRVEKTKLVVMTATSSWACRSCDPIMWWWEYLLPRRSPPPWDRISSRSKLQVVGTSIHITIVVGLKNSLKIL